MTKKLRGTLTKQISLKYLSATLAFLLLMPLWQWVNNKSTAPIHPDPAFYRTAHYTINDPNTSQYEYPIKELAPNDYNTLIDLKNFTFNIVSNTCDGSSVLLLVLVHSASKHFKRRKKIRDTWGQSRDEMKLVFMIGIVNDKTVQRKLEKEHQDHSDIVQGNFIDSYRNLTYKHVTCFKYAIYHCAQAKYILKADDDVIVKIESLMSFLEPPGIRNLLLCKVYWNTPALRSYRFKWRASFSEYPFKIYPNYCKGYAIIYSPDVLFALYREVQKSQYFWIDDVHITGILAKRLNVIHTDIFG